MTKIYQQTNSQGFHIGTSANEEWFLNDMGALDVEAPQYDRNTHRAKWDADIKGWIIKTKQEWEIANESASLIKYDRSEEGQERLEQEASQVEAE